MKSQALWLARSPQQQHHHPQWPVISSSSLEAHRTHSLLDPVVRHPLWRSNSSSRGLTCARTTLTGATELPLLFRAVYFPPPQQSVLSRRHCSHRQCVEVNCHRHPSEVFISMLPGRVGVDKTGVVAPVPCAHKRQSVTVLPPSGHPPSHPFFFSS